MSKKDELISSVPKFDYRTIGIAALLSGGLGIGGGMLGPAGGIDENQFRLLQKEIHSEVAILEQRSEKRYKRGMAFGEKMEVRAIQAHSELNELKVQVGKLEAEISLLKCK